MALTTLATVISASRGYVSTPWGESAGSEGELFLPPNYLRYPELFLARYTGGAIYTPAVGLWNPRT